MKKIILGEKIKWLRETFEFSQEELAKILKIPRPAIAMIESNKRDVSAFELLILSDTFNIDMRYLMVADLKGIKAQYELAKVNPIEHKHYLTL